MWGFSEKRTRAKASSGRSSALMMARIWALALLSWRQTTLTSRPMTSTPERAQVNGPFSSGMKPSGRMPTHMSPSGAPGTGSTPSWPISSLPPATRPSNTLMGGVPRNLETNRFTGSSYTSWGLPIWLTTPSFITTIMSEMDMASSWSWVTNTRGIFTTARAMATRCCWPPDISPGLRSIRPSICTSFAASITRRSISSFEGRSAPFRFCSGNMMFSFTVRWGYSA